MNPTGTDTVMERPHAASVRTLVETIKAALHGTSSTPGWRLPGEAGGALGPDAAVTPLSAPDGLWAVLREAADAQVLCVHNPSERTVVVSVSELLPATAGRPAYFIRGNMRTAEGPDGLVVHLLPFDYAWLAFPTG